MSTTPLKWRQVVIEHYGSIAKFGDLSTVKIIREQIKIEQKDIAAFEQIERDHPGVLKKEDLSEMREKVRQLAELDAELALWIENRKAAVDT